MCRRGFTYQKVLILEIHHLQNIYNREKKWVLTRHLQIKLRDWVSYLLFRSNSLVLLIQQASLSIRLPTTLLLIMKANLIRFLWVPKGYLEFMVNLPLSLKIINR